MLLSIQFPFADARKFLPQTGLLEKPNWSYPTPDVEFVHFFGMVRYRRSGGVAGWVGEGKICEAPRALRFNENFHFVHPQTDFHLECAFRRFYFDGQAVGKYEVGLSTTADNLQLTQPQTSALINYFLKIPVRIPQSANEKPEDMAAYELVRAADPLARLYRLGSTAVPRNQTNSQADWWVSPGPPVMLIEYQGEEQIRLPRHARQVNLPENYGLDLSFDRFSYSGGVIPLWALRIKSHDFATQERARTLRLYLLRLHAEHICLGLILRLLVARKIAVAEWSAQSNDLQRYLTKATERIRNQELKSAEKFDTAVPEIARESMSLMNPGDREALQEMLAEFAPRPAVVDDVIDYANGPEMAKIRRLLIQYFKEDELQTLCFDLGIDYESLPAVGKAGKARELVGYCDRNGRIPELIDHIRQERPNLDWD